MVIKFIYLGQCDVGQNELEDFLAAGNDMEVGGLMEDVNLKDIEETVVENGTHNTQEHSRVKIQTTQTLVIQPGRCLLRRMIAKSFCLLIQQEGGRFALQ